MSLSELHSCIDTFLIQYRNAIHASTGKSPALLFKGRRLRSASNLDTSNVMFFRGNNSRPCDGLVIGKIGGHMFHVLDRSDGTVHRRHRDQLNFTNGNCNSNTSDSRPSRSDDRRHATVFSDDNNSQSTSETNILSSPMRSTQRSLPSVQAAANSASDMLDTASIPDTSSTSNLQVESTERQSIRRSTRNRRPPKKYGDSV